MPFLARIAKEIAESLLSNILGPEQKTWVIISGGPAEFAKEDAEHDQVWDNYIRPVMLLQDGRYLQPAPAEKIAWLIFKPAYDKRFTSDKKRNIKIELADGATDYVSHVNIRAKAPSRFITPQWVSSANEVWSFLSSQTYISRVWFIGHGLEGDLWLEAVRLGTGLGTPPPSSTLSRKDIGNTALKKTNFVPSSSDEFDKTRVSMFVACNSQNFAQKFAETFEQWASGSIGKVTFKDIVGLGGKVRLVSGARWLIVRPNGDNASELTESWLKDLGADMILAPAR